MSVIRKLSKIRNFNKNFTSLAVFTKSYSSNASNFILHSDLPDVEIPNASIDQHLFANIEKWPKKIATECASSGRKYTYEEVYDKVINLSRNFRKKLKLQKGDVVAVVLTNSPEFIIVTLGAIKAGLVVTTVNPVYTPDEISRQFKDSSTKAIITFTELYQLTKSSIHKSIPIITIKTQQGQATPEGALNFDEFIEKTDYPDLPPADPSDVAFLPYSSGTTGLPKGVQLSHRNIMANLCQFNSEELLVVEETTNGHQDVVPAVLPKFHIYGLSVNTLHLFHRGAKTVALSRFTPDLYINTLRKYKPDVLFVAPPLVHFLTGHHSVTSGDLQSVRTIVSGAAPLGALDEERFLKKAQKNINILQGYGLTETSPMIAMTRPNFRQIPNSSGTIGRPVSLTSMKIVDPNDPKCIPLGVNQRGELLVKGPQVMKGYHNRPEENEQVFAEGWFRTGDIAYYNEDKLLFLTDRLKELIKVKGFQVAPAELEEVIRDFPGVEEAAVIGIPHPNHGEVPRAYIVPNKKNKVNIRELEDYVKKKVAHYKQLRGGVVVVDSIPKNASGKILRKSLKTEYEKSIQNQ